MKTEPFLRPYPWGIPAFHRLAVWGLYFCLVWLATGCGQTSWIPGSPTENLGAPSQMPAALSVQTPTPQPFPQTALPSQALPNPSPSQRATTFPSTALPPTGRASSTPTQSPETPYRLAHSIQFGEWEGVSALAWSSDGSQLAVAAGQRVHVYRTSDFTVQHTFTVTDWTGSLEFSPGNAPEGGPEGGHFLAVAVRSGEVVIWESAAGEIVCTLPAHTRGANRAAWSPDAPILASAGDDPIVRLWDVTTLLDEGACPAAPAGELIGAARAVPDLEFSPSGDELASVDGPAIRLRDPATRRLVLTLRTGGLLYDLAYHPSGALIASTELGPAVRIWDLAAGQAAASWPLNADKTIPAIQSFPSGAFAWAADFHPDGSLLAAGASDGQVLLWDWEADPTGQDLWTWQAHRRAVPALAFSPDGLWLASGSLDGTLHIWNMVQDENAPP